ncbi:hypothetical protein E2C01_067584 [Portunus trituberculatus]|uniref:Uncharacterized protein n=1 Tax=Portunus trituberculatus TaxID=210409 RepID=A0A5B7HK67_PORTR|nr:hypothetical protein [Portunus trituberculatus]
MRALLGSRSREVAGVEIRSRWVMRRIRGQVMEYLDALFLSLPSNAISNHQCKIARIQRRVVSRKYEIRGNI